MLATPPKSAHVTASRLLRNAKVAAKDKAAIVDFYSSLFGWEVNSDNPMDCGLTEAKDGDVGITGGFYQAEGDNGGLRIYA